VRFVASPLTARTFFRDPVAYVRARGGEAGVILLAAGPRRFALVRDPEEVWRVLVTDAAAFRQGKWKRRARRYLGDTLNTLDGEDHRARRLLLQPVLDRRRIATFSPAVVRRVERAQAGWESGAHVRLRDELDPLSLTVAGDVLLSSDLEPDARGLARALATVMAGVPRLTPPLAGTRRAQDRARVDRAVAGLIAERRGSPRGEGDLIGTLLGAGLPERTIRGEVLAFLLAAVDEPPSALAAAWYLLGRHPEAEERFHAELDSVLGGRPPAADDDGRLPYVDAVIREALRLFPPARHVDRCPTRDVEICGEHVRAGTNVLVSPLVTHHEPRLYDRPSAFLPERWLGPAAAHPRGAYLPFGAGVHTCIGEPLARMIVTLTLATTGRRWRLRVEADAPAPVPRASALVVTLERR